MKSQNKLEFGICHLSVACVWKNAFDGSKLISQLLFGETVRILSVKNKHWIRIECSSDGLIGWMDPKQLHRIDEETYTNCNAQEHYSLELMYGIFSSQRTIPISIGSKLNHFDGINVKMPFGKFQFSGQAFSYEGSSINDKLVTKISNKFLHCPEMKGGKSILGIDAPGFVQLVYKFLGVKLPRYADIQSNLGDDIGFVAQAKIGDLAYFTSRTNPEICHVGLVVGPMSIIHVHGKVKIDKLDQQGIYDLETRRYTYKLRTIRRILDIEDHSDVASQSIHSN